MNRYCENYFDVIWRSAYKLITTEGLECAQRFLQNLKNDGVISEYMAHEILSQVENESMRQCRPIRSES